jgi:hypothetical protein
MNSSLLVVFSDGRRRWIRSFSGTARSKRPLLAMTTRSVRSRNVGLPARPNVPHAHEPLAPWLFCQMTSPRSSSCRSSCRIRMMSADRLR